MSHTKILVKMMPGKGISQTYSHLTRVTQQRALCNQYARVVNPNALALITSPRSAVNHQDDQIYELNTSASSTINHQDDQIHKDNSGTLLGKADKCNPLSVTKDYYLKNAEMYNNKDYVIEGKEVESDFNQIFTSSNH